MPRNFEHSPATCIRAWHALRRTHDRISRRIDAALAECCALSSTELQALVLLQEAGDGVKLTSICEQVGLSQPAVSRLVERLETRGLIERRIDETDRRSVILRLTESGTMLTQQATAVHADTVGDALGTLLADPDQRRLLEAFQQLDDHPG